MRVPFATQAYKSRSLPVSAQRVVNLYAEVQPPDAKAPLVLFGTPGLTLFATVGDGPIRGKHYMAGVLYVVSGEKLFSVTSGASATEIGTVGGSSTVAQMSDNGTQLGILVGPTNTELFVYNRNTATLSQVTDPDYPGAISMTYMDGYTIFAAVDSGQFFITNLLDTTNFDALDYATAEGAPDNNVAVIADHRELWVFGQETTEVWYNSGAADFPFDRLSGAFLERGCLASLSVAKADNTVLWLGDDKIVYRADGYKPMRISTHAIESEIDGWANPELAEAFTYSQEGHAFYVLTSPEATLVYDIASGLWHQRESFNSAGESLGRWRARCYPTGGAGNSVLVYGKRLVGDYVDGKIWELDLSGYAEGENVLKSVATSATIHKEGRFLTHSRLEIEFETGVGLTTGQGSDPQAILRWSDDDGRTWSNELSRSIGAIGAYKGRAIWTRLGRSRSRIYEVTISDPVKRVIIAANAEVA